MRLTRSIKTAPLAALALLCACGGGGGSSPPGDGGGIVPPSSSPPPTQSAALAAVNAAARPITGGDQDFADIIAAAAPARRVLLGESSHGTSEYYRTRARISERLIREQGVNAVTIEGDWSPTWRANLYVRGLGTDRSAAQALSGFTRFPAWMWGNNEFRDFVERLREINLARPANQRVGLYGMDVYDLYDAADFVTSYLQQADPAAAARVRTLYACFNPYGRSTAQYGRAATSPAVSCQDEAQAAIAEVTRVPAATDPERAEHRFAAARAAASVAQAEEYFRISYSGQNSWNARDRSMEANVEAIAAHVGAQSGQLGKTVSWSHNTHTGDARATEMGEQGDLNLGQLMRQRHGEAALLVGFFSYSGTVFAAPDWDMPGRVYTMLPALAGSYSALFRDAEPANFSLLLRGNAQLASHLQGPMLQRAIGVVYRPETERQSHYFNARLAQQFDAAIFFDQSNAVTPL